MYFKYFKWALFSDAASKWSDHNAPRLGAALAYYAVLSLAPLLVIVVAICGFAFGEQAVRGQLYWQIRSTVGDQAAQFVQTLIKDAHRPGRGLVASTIGFLILIFGASGVFVELRDTLNYIWDVPVRNSSGIKGMLRHRVFSFAMILGIGFLLIVSLTVSALIQAAGDYSKQFIYLTPQFLEFLNFLVTFFTTSFLFGLMYRVIPEVHVDWEDVATGSVLTAILFAIGKFLIGFYLGRASVGSAYGAAGSLVVLLVWVYYSSQIFLYGAELTRVYADSRRAAESSPPAKQGTLDVNVQG